NRIMKKAAHETEIKVAREKGREAGREEGKYNKAKENTIMLFKAVYPKEEIDFLDGLTANQYDRLFKMLIDGESLEAIKAFVEK
uniref:hypothetical protein n=1 Tax=Thomasclavelia sp. TaxID=3025757 RepID=UPI0025F8B262